MLEPNHADVSLRRQCRLLGMSRSSAYYHPGPQNAMNLRLMELIDRQYTATPFYGVPRMTEWLRRDGWRVNPKRVRRLMRRMGLEAIYPKKRLSIPDKEHRVYPYLLRGLDINRPDQVWASDITYIRLTGGFVYLTVVMDWHSRYVLAWELSNTLDATFCVDALKRALTISKPGIFNSDQGSQYTSEAFTGVLQKAGVSISMDGKGRVFDNIFVERLWRTVKYEEVYLKDYASMPQTRESLERYFRFYNHERPHQALAWRTPAEKYFGTQEETGGPKTAITVATPDALRASSVATANEGRFHLKSDPKWS